MADTATLTIAGNVVADPLVSGMADNPDRVAFRVISNRRRRDSETGEWIDAGEYGMNIVCWRRLARGVANSVRKGDPVLVRGRIGDREYTGSDGQRRWHTEVTADFVGPDLSQGIAGRFTRFSRMEHTSSADSDGVPAARQSDEDQLAGSDSMSAGSGTVASSDTAPSGTESSGTESSGTEYSGADGFDGDHASDVFGDDSAGLNAAV